MARGRGRARREAKRQARQERKMARIAGRNERSANRNKTKQVAYQHGVNPNQFISDLGKTVGRTVGAVAGFGAAGKAATSIFGGRGGASASEIIGEPKKEMSFFDKILDLFGLYKG